MRLHRRHLRRKLRELRARLECDPCGRRDTGMPAEPDAHSRRHTRSHLARPPAASAGGAQMRRVRPELLTMESPFPEAHSMMRFLEPPGSCEQTLWTRLFDGTYDKPFIVDSGLRRFLQFDLDAVQSAMDLTDPDRLSLAYTRRMMA